MPKVSIIVPVFNAAQSLERCIDSILNQEFKDFELILSDDGSKDASGEICDRYAAQDERVKVIHKENSGVSDTRNCALDIATGEYLQFVDADDWLTADATKLLVRVAQEHQADLVIADFYRVVGERVSHKGDIEADGVLTKAEFAACMMENPADFYYGVLWNKLYRRELVEQKKLRMDVNVSWCEDFLFNLEYILHAQVFYALQVPVYYYVKTKGSLVNQGISVSKTIKMKLAVFEYYNAFYKDVFDEKEYSRKRLGVYRFFLDAAGDGSVGTLKTKRLGEERVPVYAGEETRDNVLFHNYFRRKLIDGYVKAIAVRFDMDIKEIVVLLYLSQTQQLYGMNELADYTGYSVYTVSRIMQKLIGRKLIEIKTEKLEKLDKLDKLDKSDKTGKKNKRQKRIIFTEEAAGLREELEKVLLDYDMVRFDGMTEAEQQEYLRLDEIVNANVQRVIR